MEHQVTKCKPHYPCAQIFDKTNDGLMRYCARFNSSPIEEFSENLLKIKNNSLDDWYKQVQDAYDVLFQKDKEDLPANFLALAEGKYQFSIDTYENTKAKIVQQLKLISAVNQPMSSSQIEPRPKIVEQPEIYLQLPPCDTETFYGGYDEWPSFRDMFTAVYINHPLLSPAQKLYHLRYKTRGQAGDIVKRFALTNDNFQLAWDALHSPYENKRQLVDNQVTTLLNLPKVRKETSEEFINALNTSSRNPLLCIK
uniref:Uncharacterized protein n=1 Tax=Ceratitis capitata TaxID=7213 RepID=W8ACZ8_CERCA